MTATPVDPRTILIIHHSHTDLGYTETQGRVARWHRDFLRQALEIIERPGGRAPDGWKWQCETFWAVERFWETASAGTRAAFVRAVRSGHLGLSGSYLNLSELLDYDILQAMTKRAADFGKSIGVPVESAMTADINGYSWGFSQALHDNGIANLFTCIHTHHGMFPLGRTQVPFWWETPKGDRVLVWSGEHYHFGNELGVVPGAVSSYLTKDECDAEMIFSDHWKVAEIRIPRYLDRLRQAGYAYPFVPVMASGLRTDNGPPNSEIADFCARWNRSHADWCRVEMTTLSEFFRRVREEDVEVPVHRGDWPDWWSDGCAGNPATTRIFRQTQRDLSGYRRLLDRYPQLVREAIDHAEYTLALYAEHTFSHSDAMSQPWHPLVHAIAARKKAFASEAQEAVEQMTDRAMKALGASELRVGRPLRFRVLNPLPHA
ncbi:MAG: glycoside hydrolase, partial [Gemmatimonadales bacterium]|nr:glycoside hydrolase [Gemmatimonadales bacterium]